MHAPACRATGECRSISEKMRRGILEPRVPWTRRGETLDIGEGADGLGLGVRPGGADPRDVAEADRIEDRRMGRNRRTEFETLALQGVEGVGDGFRSSGEIAIVGHVFLSCPNGVNRVDQVLIVIR